MRQRPGLSEIARAWMPGCAVAALWTFSFLALKPTPLEGIDYVRFFQPYQHYLRESLLRGELPWWNPYSSLGRPFLVDLQTAAFYPATLLVIFFGAKAGWVMGTFLHGLLAMGGFGRLARKFGCSAETALFGGAVFLFCGPLYARMQEGEVNYVYSLCYWPLVLWISYCLAEEPTRRRWVALAVTWALQLLCGHPQIFWLSAVAAGFWTTGALAFPPWKQALRRWLYVELALLTACLTALGLLGFILVPFMELASQSNRAEASLAFSGAFAMRGLQWMSLVWPTWSAFGVNWEYNLFAGVSVVIGGLAAIARWREPAIRGALFLAAGAAVIAAGSATPLFPLLFAVLPGMSSFRVPARAAALLPLVLVLGAAMVAGRDAQGRRTRFAVAGLAAVALVRAVLFALRPGAGPFPEKWLALEAFFACVAGLGWWLWIGRKAADGGFVRVARRIVLPMAVIGECCVSIHGIKRAYRFDFDFPGEAMVLQAIHAVGGDQAAAPPRVCVDSMVFRENAGMIYHVASVVGYESLSLARVWNYLHLAVGVDPSHAFNTVPDGHIFNGAAGLHAFSLCVGLGLDSHRLMLERNPDPRVYLAPRTRTVPDSRAAIQAMIAGDDFHDTALVEAPYSSRFETEPAKPAGTAVVTGFSLNAVDVDVTSPGKAVLVLAEAWYPGWEASISGVTVPCAPVNDWMRGVPVPAGKSIVRLRFHQDGLRPGFLLSAAAALALFFAWKPRFRVS
jgi:hypothetical protein